MLTDKRLTWVLRFVVAVVATIAYMLVIITTDAALDDLSRHIFGLGFPKAIESAFFLAVTWSLIWGWVKRKIWIGSQAKERS